MNIGPTFTPANAPIVFGFQTNIVSGASQSGVDRLRRPTPDAPDEHPTMSVEGLFRLNAIITPRLVSSHARPIHTMKHLIPLFLLMLVCGCTSTLTKAELEAKATEHAGSASPDHTYYVGSDADYDYFVIRGGLAQPTRLYRVAESEGAVTNPFPATKDEKYWRSYDLTGTVVTNGAAAIPK